MYNCPKCNRQVEDSQALFCGSCGADLNQSLTNSSDNNDDLDFVVTETAGVDSEFVGGTNKFENSAESESESEENDDYGSLQSDPIGSEAAAEEKPDTAPIGQSAPFLPDQEEIRSNQDEKPEPALSGSQGIKKLSDDEVKSINENLYGNLSKNEKSDLVNKLKTNQPKNEFGADKKKSKTKPVQDLSSEQSDLPSPNQSDLPSPKMAEKSKGVAYFYNKYIELPSAQGIFAGDELEFHDRLYELAPKQFNSTGYKITAVSLFALLLLFIGSLFVGDPNGYGQIVGIVYDVDGVPYTGGATMVLPDDGVRTTSNGEGFFIVNDLPAGPHKIECYVNEKLVMSDMLTVSESETSTVAFSPAIENIGEIANKSTRPSDANQLRSEVQPVQSEQIIAETKPVQQAKPTSTPKQKKITTAGKVVLSANVDGAKLLIDGKVMGAGNLTYSNIKTGNHQYTVSSDGYKTSKGSFNLKSGEKKTLTIALTPMSAEEKAAAMTGEDLYYSGIKAFKAGNITTAIADLSSSIVKEPGNPTAYYYRGESYSAVGQKDEALSDYIRAAEQFRFAKKYSDAISSYGKAIDLAPEDITAYLGRGQLYLDKKSSIAALADFEFAVDINKKNFQAQYGLGQARFAQGNYKKAIDHFKKARSIDSKNSLTYQYLMLSYLASDKIGDVKKSYKKFREVASENELAEFQNNRKNAAVMAVIKID